MMKTPTDKQFKARVISIRKAVREAQRRVDDIKSYDREVIGTSQKHLLQTTLDALKIADFNLLESQLRW